MLPTAVVAMKRAAVWECWSVEQRYWLLQMPWSFAAFVAVVVVAGRMLQHEEMPHNPPLPMISSLVLPPLGQVSSFYFAGSTSCVILSMLDLSQYCVQVAIRYWRMLLEYSDCSFKLSSMINSAIDVSEYLTVLPVNYERVIFESCFSKFFIATIL